MTIQATISPSFRKRLETLDLPENELAGLLGVTVERLNRIRAGHEAPSPDFVFRALDEGLANKFGDVVAPIPWETA